MIIGAERRQDFTAIDQATVNPQGVEPDGLAREEEAHFNKELRVEVHRVVKWSLRVGAFALGLLVLVRFWHLGAPETWRWLSEYDLQGMDKILFSSAFGGFVLTYLRDSIMQNGKR